MDLRTTHGILIEALIVTAAIAIAQPDASQTLLWGEGLDIVHAGEPSSFFLQTRAASGPATSIVSLADRDIAVVGSNVTVDASEIAVACVSDPEKPTDFCIQDPAIVDAGSGFFRVEFTVGRFWAAELNPWTEGLFPNALPEDFFSLTDDRIAVTVDGDHVTGSPFAPLLLGAAELDPSHCLIDSSTSILFVGVPGGLGEFQTIRDSFGNNIRPSDAHTQITGRLTLTAPFVWSSDEEMAPVVTATWILTNWYIDFQAICYVAGHYVFEALYLRDGSPSEAIPILSATEGSPTSSVNIDCAPGKIERMTMEGNGEVDLGSEVNVLARAYDAYGNAAYFGDAVKVGALRAFGDQSLDDVHVRVEHVSCDCELITSLRVELDTQHPGSLSITFSTDTEGRHRIYVLYRGVDYVQSTFEILFQETPPAPPPPTTTEWAPAPASASAPESSVFASSLSPVDQTARETLPPQVSFPGDPAGELLTSPASASAVAETPVQVDPASCLVDATSIAVDGQISLMAGEKRSFFVLLRDKDQNPAGGNALELTVWLINLASPMEGLIQVRRFQEENAALGNYTVEISAEKAGTYDLLVTYGGQPLPNESSTVVVRPADEVSIEKSIIAGSAIGIEIGTEQSVVADNYRQIAGRNMSLVITAVDPFGNTHVTTRPGFQLNQAIHTAASWLQVFEFGDGKTRFYFAIEKTGVYDLIVTYSTSTVYKSNLEIGPGIPLPSKCRVFGMERGVAGEVGKGFLEVLDSYGNLYDVQYKDLINLTQFRIELRHERSLPVDSANDVRFTAYSAQRSAVLFEYNVTRSGVYHISARWENLAIEGDGDSLPVLPTNLSFAQTSAADVSSDMNAGEAVVFRIVARDRFGNIATEEERLEQRTTVDVTRLAANEKQNATVQIVEVHPGLLEATVHLTIADRYAFRVRIDGREITAGSESFTVHPSELSKETSAIVLRKEVSTGDWNDVVVFPRDRFANSLTRSLNFSLQTNASTIQIQDFRQDNVTGLISAQYRVDRVGKFTIGIRYNTSTVWSFQIQAIDESSESAEKQNASRRAAQGWSDDVITILVMVLAALLILTAYWIYSRDSTGDSSSSDGDTHRSGSECIRFDDAHLIAKSQNWSEIKAFRP